MSRTTTSKSGVSASNAAPTGGGTVAPARPVAVAAPAKPSAAKASHDQVCKRAYEIYLERCQRGKPGTAHADWAQAEAELNRG
jgi:hypothetical protein